MQPAPHERMKAASEKIVQATDAFGDKKTRGKKNAEIVLPENLWDKYSEKNTTSHQLLVKAIFKQIEIKDMNTASHSRAVAYYSECIGICLGITDKKLSLLKDAALLHDTGKIMVDLVILNKKGSLDGRERLQMQRHAEMGMRALCGFHLSDAITDAAWHHHERWDGAGYPDGLKGEEINLFTRIVSISDALEAMSAARPYNRPLPFDQIIQEISAGAGKQFDPKLAKKVKHLLEKGKIQIMG